MLSPEPRRPDPAAHDAFLHDFRAAIFGGALPAGVTARAPDEASQRFDVYRNNVLHSLRMALGARFPVVERLVGPAFFAAMARVFAEAHPPESPMLFEWGGAFPAFLEAFPPVAGLPYLPDVARLELARGLAYHAADRAPLPAEALAGAAARADRIALGLHPSVALIASGHAIHAIWAANQPGATPGPIEDAPETVLVLRDRALEVPVWRLDPGEAAFCAALLAGQPLLAGAEAALAASPGFAPQPLLARLHRAGALVSIEETGA
ncbi:MAG: DNA-binding domain-containing protein [Paracoccaceae bacterium]|jgi:hypothetical protein